MGIHDGHRERMKRRFLEHGADVFDDHQLLELLLFFSKPQGDVNPLAHQLMDRFGSLAAVFDADPAELTRVKGVGEHTAALITLMPALMRRYQLSRQDMEAIINTPRAAGEFLMPYFYGARNEQAYLLCLDAKGKALACDRIGEGALNSVGLDSRAAVECVLRHRASLAVLAHNHTSGVAAPSREDVSATLELERVLSAVGVELFDHILGADEDFVSFRESGLGPWKLF